MLGVIAAASLLVSAATVLLVSSIYKKHYTVFFFIFSDYTTANVLLHCQIHYYIYFDCLFKFILFSALVVREKKLVVFVCTLRSVC